MNENYLGKDVYVKVDREAGSRHPKHSHIIYPINYGYIPNTISGDGEELDAYILGIKTPLKEFKGKVIAVLRRTNDNDDKLIVVEDGKEYSNEEIRKQVSFMEQYFESIIIR